MSYLSRGLCSLLLLLALSDQAMGKCGARADDSSKVAAIEASVAGQCSCCTFKHGRAYMGCAKGVVAAAVLAEDLRPVCRRTVLAETRAVCPLTNPSAPVLCENCDSDSDCAAGTFCQCAAATCSSVGGTCVRKPEVCPLFVDPVCGCDGQTYSNDCWRQAAGACSSHAGECAASDGCYDTIAGTCTGSACTPETGCPLPNQFCTADCGATTTTTLPSSACTSNSDCDDGFGCTADTCNAGICEHACVCVSPTGLSSCCPGPATLCAKPCGTDAVGTCDGTCPSGMTCGSVAGNTGSTCGCVADNCIPFFASGCAQTSDCCQPCLNGQIAPCAVCQNGQCMGVP